MIKFNTVSELVSFAEKNGKSISDVVIMWEMSRSERTEKEIWDDMTVRLEIMKEAVNTGVSSKEKSMGGLTGGDAFRMHKGSGLVGHTVNLAIRYALAVSEVNACMGKIVACPTAGSCGIVPGALLATAEYLQCDDETLVRALFVTAGVGEIIAKNATVSGAVGGCQAECGSAAAMAAAAVVEMMGGTPKQATEALALAMKNMLGLVCDPIAGLVEVPCVKRNAFAASHALVAAEMALAGIESFVPADEVIEAMYRIGLDLPRSLKETSEGGLAKTPTGIRAAENMKT
jgi:L-serine dehydratase